MRRGHVWMLLSVRAPAAGVDALRVPHLVRSAGRRVVAALWSVEVLVSVLAGFLYGLASLERFARYQSGLDLAVFGQAVQAYSRFQIPYVLIKAQAPFNILGDHFSPVIALIAPLYRVFPHIQVLLIVQAVLLAWAVWLVGRLARRRLGARWAGRVEVCFAVSWGIVALAAYDFHEVAFAVPFTILAITAALDDRWAALAVWCALLCLTKEDCTFIIGGIALLLLARRRIFPAIAVGVSSVAAFLLLIKLVIPYFSFSHKYTYFAAVAGGGPAGMLANVAGMMRQPTAWLLIVLLVVALGMGIRSPVALVLLPTLVSRLVSNNAVYWQVNFQYQATLLAICAVAAIDAWAQVMKRPRRGAGVLGIAHLAIQTLVSVTVVQLAFGWGSLLGLTPVSGQARNLERAVASVPPGVSIVSDAFAAPHLVDVDTVYIATPTWTDSVGVPLSANWVLLDEDSPADRNRVTPWVKAEEATLQRHGFSCFVRYGTVVVLRRETRPGSVLEWSRPWVEQRAC